VAGKPKLDDRGRIKGPRGKSTYISDPSSKTGVGLSASKEVPGTIGRKTKTENLQLRAPRGRVLKREDGRGRLPAKGEEKRTPPPNTSEPTASEETDLAW